MSAKRVRKKRPSALAARPLNPEADEKFLSRERAMQGARRLEELFVHGDGSLPSVVDTLWKLFNDDSTVTKTFYNKDGTVAYETETERVSTKDRIAIATRLADFIAIKDAALAERGLGKGGPQKVVNNNHFTQVNLSHEDVQRLPEDIREKLCLDAVAAAREGK